MTPISKLFRVIFLLSCLLLQVRQSFFTLNRQLIYRQGGIIPWAFDLKWFIWLGKQRSSNHDQRQKTAKAENEVVSFYLLSTVCAVEVKIFLYWKNESCFFFLLSFFDHLLYSSYKRITNKGLWAKRDINIISDNGSLGFNKTIFKSTVKRKS